MLPDGPDLDEFYGPNAGYAQELLERQTAPPASSLAEVVAPEVSVSPDVPSAAAASALAQNIRLFGHRGARLDPLGSEPPGDPHLDYGSYGLREEDLARLPASVVGGGIGKASLPNALEAIRQLERIYSGSTGYEIAHVEDPAERMWLLDAIEEGRFRPPKDPIDDRELLDRLTEVSAFERFLHRAYPGQTRFSVEGLGMLIPMLDELIADLAGQGTHTLILGMAHRGRLNVLAHVLGKPYDRILAEFEGRETAEITDRGWAGDVKYHAGARRESGSVTVVMAPNPSHLEFVDPVVQGMARAPGDGALAVLIHGDASFPGQGVVAETLNLGRLRGYSTGGTLHIIANNQLGFTTEPRDGRSTLYASDLAKGFEMPIVHVNADDPVACLASIRLAAAYRAKFQQDFLIDLVGYRRWGHNEGDDPSLTQPRAYAAIEKKPTVRELFAADLVRRGVVRQGDPEAFLKAGLDEFQRIRERVRDAVADRLHSDRLPTPQPPPLDLRGEGEDSLGRRNSPSLSEKEGEVSPHENNSPSLRQGGGWGVGRSPDREGRSPDWEMLKNLNAALVAFPDGFNVHPKLTRALQRRRDAFEKPDAPIEWAHAEALAFATLLTEGVPIRLSGQDTIRGTFSQRHLSFYDARTGAPFTPLEQIARQHQASFQALNSPLSENATLGFEYGYSIQSPETLVLWEAQYGDFINGAQVIVDEFVVSGQAKWGLSSGLVLLLPHAWEGQGPDHSSGRLERFLQLASENNIHIANCTTAAQYYFLLRRQAASLGAPTSMRPLVLMTPKSLLRHPQAASPASDFVDGRFEPVLDDAIAAAHPGRIRRVTLCSGHIWAELRAHASDEVALIRIEQLYPFPSDALTDVLEKYTRADEIVWAQEEPQNMGAWTYVERALAGTCEVRYVGRPESASPAEGWAHAHNEEQQRIVNEVIGGLAVHG